MSSDLAVAARGLSKAYELGLTGRKDSLLKILERRLRNPISGGAPPKEILHALSDVSFDIRPGEAVGFIGRNGAGKSTLLKILSRITPPSAGSVELRGKVGSLLEVGTGFHPELTGLENVYLNGSILGMTRTDIDARLDEIVAFAEVDRFLDTPVKRYSSGMRVRLAFAVAAHLEPEILIVDEVLSVGDTAFQAKSMTKMRDIAADDGRTVLYVSHNLVTLEHLCPRAMVLHFGELVFDGTAKEAIATYFSMFPHGTHGAAGTYDLTQSDRESSGYAPVFERVQLRPNGGEPSDTVRMGEHLRIEIDVEGLDRISDATIALDVMSHLDDHLARITTAMLPLTVSGARTSRETIVLDLPRVDLTPGEYYIDLLARDPAHKIDYVKHAAEFTVDPADLMGTGYRFQVTDGHFVLPWEWELRPAGPAGGTDPAASS